MAGIGVKDRMEADRQEEDEIQRDKREALLSEQISKTEGAEGNDQTVQQQVQAFIEDLPSEEELPDYVIAYLSQRTDDDSLPEHILEYLQDRVVKLQKEEQEQREKKDDEEDVTKLEDSFSEELPEFVKAYLLNRQDDDSLPENILQYLQKESERIKLEDSDELELVEQTLRNIDRNQFSSYNDHYPQEIQPEEIVSDPFDQMFAKTNKAENPTSEKLAIYSTESVREDKDQVEPEKKRRFGNNVKEAMRSISVPTLDGFSSIKRSVQKVNAETMKKLKPPKLKRTQSPSPIRQRIGEGFSRVKKRFSSLTHGKEKIQSKMEIDVEDGYEPIAHPSLVPFQMTTYESEDQIPKVYGLGKAALHVPGENFGSKQEDEEVVDKGISKYADEISTVEEFEEEEKQKGVGNDLEQIERKILNKPKAAGVLSKGKCMWNNTTAKSGDALKTAATKSKDAFAATANRSKTAINKSKSLLQNTAVKSKEVIKTTGEKLKLKMQKKPDKIPTLDAEDSLEGTSSAIFDVESPLDNLISETNCQKDIDAHEVPSFSCDVVYSTPKSNQPVKNLTFEISDTSEDFSNYFQRSQTIVDPPVNRALSNSDYLNYDPELCLEESLLADQGEHNEEIIEPKEAVVDKRCGEKMNNEDTSLAAVDFETKETQQILENSQNSMAKEGKFSKGDLKDVPQRNETIEKPVRKSKLLSKISQIAVTIGHGNDDTTMEPQITNTVVKENLEEETSDKGILSQSLSHPERHPKIISTDGPPDVIESGECYSINEETQKTLRPIRSKKSRTLSDENCRVKTPLEMKNSFPVDVSHYSIPKTIDVDIETFNEKIKAAMHSEEDYNIRTINPGRPSRSRAKKKTAFMSTTTDIYQNIPLRKRKSFSRDLPNVLNSNNALSEEAPSTLPRKKVRIPKEPYHSHLNTLDSASIAQSITTFPRRKKNVSKTARENEENIASISTFPRQKRKNKIKPENEANKSTKQLREIKDPNESIQLDASKTILNDSLQENKGKPATLPRRRKGSQSSKSTGEKPTESSEKQLSENIKEKSDVSKSLFDTDNDRDHCAIHKKESLEKVPCLSPEDLRVVPEGDESSQTNRVKWTEVKNPVSAVDDGYGYAVITKVGQQKKKKPPRPPPPVPDDQSEQYEYPICPSRRPVTEIYCTVPRRRKHTKPTDSQFESSFCTLRPERPRRRSSEEKKQSTSNPCENDHIEELQSREIVDRMNKRPLPPLPRSKKKREKIGFDNGSDRDSASDIALVSEDDQNRNIRPCPMSTIISNEWNQENAENVQTGKFSFSLSCSTIPVSELAQDRSQAEKSEYGKRDTFSTHGVSPCDNCITMDVKYSNQKPSKAVGIPSTEDYGVIIEQQTLPSVEPDRKLILNGESTESTSSFPVENVESEVTKNIFGQPTINSNLTSPVFEYSDIRSDPIDLDPDSYSSLAYNSSREKGQQLHEIMNEVENNLETHINKGIEDKIILISPRTTQKESFTPIDEVSISIQTEPSIEFEPLVNMMSRPSQDSERVENFKTEEAVGIQSNIQNSDIRFPLSIPINVPEIPPIQVDLPQKMRLSELEVDRLTVGCLSARSVSTEDITSNSIQVNQIQSLEALNVTVAVDPSTIHLQVPEIPPQHVVHVYERSETPVSAEVIKLKNTQDDHESKEAFSKPPSNFSSLRAPSEPLNPTVRELATQLATTSARELGSMAAEAVTTVSSASQLVLRNIVEGMWSRVNEYLEDRGIFLDTKEQDSSKILMVCLLLLVLFVIFFGMRVPRGPRWEYYLPPNY
ncbi:uncharacterized protein LOC136037184 isoform X2 [Artemia franciscana]